MPHKCTKCDSIFKDGAAIILNGCPKCGWNKFLYVRDEKMDPAEKTERSEGSIPQAATKFIQEVDDILSHKDVSSEKKDVKEVKKPEEIGNRVESVRILSPGQYELNLDSILKREEIVMALREDGTYIVHLPSVFQKKKHNQR
ncbi:MAG: Zn-ribbon domain-containing protein [Candidatus Methanoperedens sp.]|nr:Zn-ribbon domain-containing protein [Candidatus Methanoperedens sp.]MCE8425948.1 Zn-ribbon domain-containing protein [Candidatus Methanoperedens sp.]MCE8427377.1 Zn-ribbon domain-containing protein [Candidatus Methanoperedens sp.]